MQVSHKMLLWVAKSNIESWKIFGEPLSGTGRDSSPEIRWPPLRHYAGDFWWKRILSRWWIGGEGISARLGSNFLSSNIRSGLHDSWVMVKWWPPALAKSNKPNYTQAKSKDWWDEMKHLWISLKTLEWLRNTGNISERRGNKDNYKNSSIQILPTFCAWIKCSSPPDKKEQTSRIISCTCENSSPMNFRRSTMSSQFYIASVSHVHPATPCSTSFDRKLLQVLKPVRFTVKVRDN